MSAVMIMVPEFESLFTCMVAGSCDSNHLYPLVERGSYKSTPARPSARSYYLVHLQDPESQGLPLMTSGTSKRGVNHDRPNRRTLWSVERRNILLGLSDARFQQGGELPGRVTT